MVSPWSHSAVFGFTLPLLCSKAMLVLFPFTLKVNSPVLGFQRSSSKICPTLFKHITTSGWPVPINPPCLWLPPGLPVCGSSSFYHPKRYHFSDYSKSHCFLLPPNSYEHLKVNWDSTYSLSLLALILSYDLGTSL